MAANKVTEAGWYWARYIFGSSKPKQNVCVEVYVYPSGVLRVFSPHSRSVLLEDWEFIAKALPPETCSGIADGSLVVVDAERLKQILQFNFADDCFCYDDGVKCQVCIADKFAEELRKQLAKSEGGTDENL